MQRTKNAPRAPRGMTQQQKKETKKTNKQNSNIDVVSGCVYKCGQLHVVGLLLALENASYFFLILLSLSFDCVFFWKIKHRQITMISAKHQNL